MTKSKYFIPVILLLFSAVVSLIGASMKFGGVAGSGAILSLGVLAHFVGIGWLVYVLLAIKRKRVE